MSTSAANIEKPRQKTKRGSTAVNEARIAALRHQLQRGHLFLNADTYRIFRTDGFSRGELQRCIELMVERNEAVVEYDGYRVIVRLVEGAEKR